MRPISESCWVTLCIDFTGYFISIVLFASLSLLTKFYFFEKWQVKSSFKKKIIEKLIFITILVKLLYLEKILIEFIVETWTYSPNQIYREMKTIGSISPY